MHVDHLSSPPKLKPSLSPRPAQASLPSPSHYQSEPTYQSLLPLATTQTPPVRRHAPSHAHPHLGCLPLSQPVSTNLASPSLSRPKSLCQPTHSFLSPSLRQVGPACQVLPLPPALTTMTTPTKHFNVAFLPCLQAPSRAVKDLHSPVFTPTILPRLNCLNITFAMPSTPASNGHVCPRTSEPPPPL